MARPSGKRRRFEDWAGLRALFETIDTQQSTNELAPAWHRGEICEPRWAPEYIPAMQQALEGRDASALLALLREQRPLHPLLLPLLAEVLSAALTGSYSGSAKKLTETQESSLREMYPHFVGRGKWTREKFLDEWSKTLGVSERTIGRIIDAK